MARVVLGHGRKVDLCLLYLHMILWLHLLAFTSLGFLLKHQYERASRVGFLLHLQLWYSLKRQRWERVHSVSQSLLAHPGCSLSYRADALRCRALVHMRSGREGEALQDCLLAVQTGRDPARSWLIRGLVLFHFRHYEPSLGSLEQCLQLARPWRLSIRRLALRFHGLALLASGRPEALDSLLRSGQATAEERASALALAGRYQQALELLGSWRPRQRLAELLLAHRHLKAAHFWIRRQLELETSLQGLLLAGRIALELDEVEEARQHFTAALSLGRSPSPEALFWYSYSLGAPQSCAKIIELAGQLWRPVLAEGRASGVGQYVGRETANANN